MSRSAQPDNWQELIAGYTLGDLSPEEVEAFQQLLADHPDLIQEVDSVQEVLALMPYALPEHDPPAHLRDSILAAAQAEQPAQIAPLPAPRRRLRWLGLAGTVAAAALIGLAVDNYRLRQEVATTRPIVTALQQPDRQIYALTGTDQAANAAGSIVIAPQQRQVLLVVQNLPALPAGQAYRLWAMPKNSQQPAFCGQFNTTATGTVTTQWAATEPLCSRQPAQLLITAESATAPPVPQGALVMKSRST